jgi:peptide/nickel transport system substrate-binding protein
MERQGWDEFLKLPVGTGPYIVEKEVKDYRKMPEGSVYATLVANSTYWKRSSPMIERISFVTHSPKEALHQLAKGEIDLVTCLTPKDTLKVAESPHAKVVKGREDVTWMVLWLNLMSWKTMPLRDMRVRKALNYAVNKEELMRYGLKGNGIKTIGVLTEKSDVDVSEAKTYEWNIPKARALLREAGYADGFKMKLYYQKKDYVIAQLLQRFYGLVRIEVKMVPCDHEWFVRHIVYPNTRKGYSWAEEDWWAIIASNPGYVPEVMYGHFMWSFRFGASCQSAPDWLIEPLDRMFHEIQKTTNRDKRFQIYKKANEYIADQALTVSIMAPISLYGANNEFTFVPQVSQYLYLDYSSVTDRHWSVRGK